MKRVSLSIPEDLYTRLKSVASANGEKISELISVMLDSLYDGDFVHIRKDLSERLKDCEGVDVFLLVNGVLEKYLDGCLVEVPHDLLARLSKEGDVSTTVVRAIELYLEEKS